MATRKAGSKRSPTKTSYGPLAARILERWRGGGGEIDLDRIVSELVEVPRYDIVAALKELEKAGAGEFQVGRSGRKPRFIWNAPAQGAARRPAPAASPAARAGAPTNPPRARPKTGASSASAPSPDAPRTLEHTFYVRPGYAATIRLPEDVTPAEIERLCRYLQALPFGVPRRGPEH